jgi:hypothetical protein
LITVAPPLGAEGGYCRRGAAVAVMAQRVTSAVILGAFLALAALSFLGNRFLSSVFIVVAGVVLFRNAASLCPRCSNLACGFNPHRKQAAEHQLHSNDQGGGPFSDLPITRTTVLPLLVTGPLAFIAAWQFDPVWAVIVAVVALSAHSVFRRITCSRCGNECAGNCNEHYREWKRAQIRPGA